MRLSEGLMLGALALEACQAGEVKLGDSEELLQPYDSDSDTSVTDSGSVDTDSGSTDTDTDTPEDTATEALPSVMNTTAEYCQAVLDNGDLDLRDGSLSVDYYGSVTPSYTPDDVRYPTEGGSFVDAYTENLPADGTRTLLACAYTEEDVPAAERVPFGVDLLDYGDGVVQATVPDLSDLATGNMLVYVGDQDGSGFRGFDSPAIYTIIVSHGGASVDIIR